MTFRSASFRNPLLSVAIVMMLASTFAARAGEAAYTGPTPVNQVFQFVQTGTQTWPDGSTTNATAYLWIPEKCQRLRGLLILCTNVPEHRLVGHPALRKACEENDLGIVWCVPSFMNFRKTASSDMARQHAPTVAFLQQLLDGLAKTSGYEEVATVPWLPMGESGHLLMVDALLEHSPDRCIAGIFIKNSHFAPKNRSTPQLVIFGSSQEWSQDKTDIRSKWNDIGKTYEGILRVRKANPQFPLSYVLDGSSGHFDCSETLTAYMADYIRELAKARLPADAAGGSPALKPAVLDAGYLADLPVPGHENKPVLRHSEAPADGRGLPWFPSQALAAQAQAIARINWQAQTQLPAVVDAQGQPLPFDFNGISKIKSVAWEADHLTFTVKGKLLDRIPEGFVAAGEPLAKGPGEPMAEWLNGPVEPLGSGRFRIALDRTYGIGSCYLALRQAGTDSIRSIVQPTGVEIGSLRNDEGKRQVITFEKLAALKAGSAPVPLLAKSDAGLPVQFFVRAGPAIVQDGKLVLTPIPPRAKFPVEVKVAAWQWGSPVEPKVRTAELAEQTVLIEP